MPAVQRPQHLAVLVLTETDATRRVVLRAVDVVVALAAAALLPAGRSRRRRCRRRVAIGTAFRATAAARRVGGGRQRREGLRGEPARRAARTGADGGVAGLGGDDGGEQGEDTREEEDACVVDDKGEEERDADEAGAHLEPDALDGVVVLGHGLSGEEEAGDEEREAADHPDEGVQLKEADRELDLVVAPPARALPRHRRALPPSCCICINCKWVDRCQTYHWVETQHEQPHVTAAPTFDPNDPQIQVFIRKEGDADADVMDGADDGSTDGMRSQILTTEYDVFACDAFEEEKGKWLRLMPDADFIPT